MLIHTASVCFILIRVTFLMKLGSEEPSPISAGEAETELKDFSPYYRRQFSIARFLQVEDDLEQRKEKTTQLLMQKVKQVEVLA